MKPVSPQQMIAPIGRDVLVCLKEKMQMERYKLRDTEIEPSLRRPTFPKHHQKYVFHHPRSTADIARPTFRTEVGA